MSEFLAEASVLVLPDTATFRKLLLAELEADTTAVSKTAAASVTITPNVAGFRKALATELGVVTKGVPAPVLVEPDLTGFRTLLNNLVAEVAKTVTAPVRVVPDFTGFALELQRGVAAIAKTVTAPVSVVPVGKPSTAAAAESVVGGGVAQSGNAAIAANAAAAEKAAAANKTASVALEAEAAAARLAGVELQKLNVTQGIAIGLNESLAAVQKQVAIAQLDVVGAGSAAQAQQITLARQTAAGVAARELLTAAQLAGVEAEGLVANAAVKSAVALGAKAAASEEASLTAKKNAVATAEEAAALSQAGRGAGSTALSMLGLRGATLAASGPFIAAAAAAIAFFKSVQLAANFQSELNVLRVTAGATADQMKLVSAAAVALGKDVSLPGVSAGDAAQAMTELSKAGLDVQDSIAGARGVLQLATAASIDNAQATELAASALNAFGLAGDQAVHVADVLTNAANDAQGSISDIGQALQQSAGVARQAGLSLEQTVAVLTLFARNGLRGSDAGTSFRTMLIKLINPTQKAQAVIKDLGLQLRTSTGAINLKFFDQFTAATKNLTKAERDKDLAIITGQDAIRGAAILAREGSAALDSQVVSLNKQGAAAALASARMAGLQGAAANLSNQLESLGLTIGRISTGPLTTLANGLSSIVGIINQDIGLFEKLGKAIADSAPDIPAPKIGPVDTKDAEASIGDFVKRNALKIALVGNPFGQALVGIPLVVKGLQSLGGGAQQAKTNLDSLIAGLSEAQGFFGTTSTQAQILSNVLVDFSKQFTQSAGGVKALENAFAAASPKIKAALEDGVITPAERSAIGVDALGQAFLALHDIPIGVNLASFGANVKSGIEDAVATAKSQASLLGPALTDRIEPAEREAAAAAGRVGPAIGKALKDGIKAAFLGAVNAVNAGAQAMQDSLNQLTVSGAGPKAFIATFQQDFARQQKVIDAANARLAELQDQGDSPAVKAARAKARAARSTALQQQAQDTTQIKSQNDQITASAQQAASDRTAAASKVKDANTKADQAVIDSFTPTQNRIDLATIRADATTRLSDNIAVQNIIIATAKAEIASIDENVKNQKTANTEIAARVKKIAAARIERDRLIKEAADAATQQRENAADLVSDRLQKRLQLAELIGAKDPILAAFNAIIKNAIKRKNAAKKGSDAELQWQIVVRQTIKDRKDFLDGLAKDAGDTKSLTAFDLLKEFNANFNNIAGNLITKDQPFAGGGAFSTDIVNKAVASIRAPATRQPGIPPGDDAVSRAIDRNTQALTANTDAILRGNGNVSTTDGKGAPGPATIGKWGSGAWWNASHFREVRDG